MATEVDLIAAVDAGDSVLVVAMLEADPGLAGAHGVDGLSALMRARYRSDRPTMDALLAVDPDLDLFEAAAYGYVDRLRALVEEAPARVGDRSVDGFTALHLAAFFGKAEVTRMLLEAGAPVDRYTTNDLSNQPLHAAAAGRNVEVCRLLIAAGADVGATQHGGYAPLHEAAQHGDVEMVELFLSAGADPGALDDAGRTAADIADAAGHRDVAIRIRAVAATR